MTSNPVVGSDLPLPIIRRGKVRDVYAVGDDRVLLIASDRISAFDIILDQPIPSKGAVLTQISSYWFRRLADRAPSHFISADADEIIAEVPELADHRSAIAGRAMLATLTTPASFECVVRGYLAGSAWKEYRASGTLAGEKLAEGLVESDRFDPPIFSPSTKAETGHDENVTFDHVIEALGSDLANELKDRSLNLYSDGREIAAERGIVIADTKFEFGHTNAGDLILIDEVLTPDSSRFWPADDYETGRGQRSFDKQPMRDYLAGIKAAGDWDGNAPAPPLSEEIVEETSTRYRDAYLRVTGENLPDFQ
jgi:phosphoribosylaminoimidazole-succinocarboxamide synthase